MTTVRQLHDEWAKKTIPKQAPPIQKEEMESAFYAGALSMFMEMAYEATKLPDHAAEEYLSALDKELKQFFYKKLGRPGHTL